MATAPKAAPKAPAGKTAEVAEAAPVAKSKPKKKMVMAIVIALVVIGGGAAGWYFTKSSGETNTLGAEGENGEPGEAGAVAAKPADKGPAKPPVYLVLEPFTVNLQQETGEAFLQISLTFQLTDQPQVELFKLYTPQVRSKILLLLSGKKASDISTPEGKKKLAEEITALITQPFTPGAAPQSISNVFFTSFVIQ